MKKIIPFHKISKGDKVLFYGAGNNCMWCYEKLIKNGYCKLVGIIDKHPFDKHIAGNEAMSIEALKQTEFDYILITIVNKEIINQVKNELWDMGVAEEKILSCYEHEMPIEKEDVCNVEDMRSYLKNRYSQLSSYVKTVQEYYPRLEQLFCDIGEQKEELLQNLKYLLSNLECDESTIILLNFMYAYKIFDKDCMQIYMKCLKEMKWKDDTCYGFVIDTTSMVFLYPEYIYDDFFRDRRILFKKICEYYGLYEIKKSVNNTVEANRVALVARRYTPEALTDAPSKIVQNYALGLAELGYHVRIFVLCAENKASNNEIFLQRLYGLETFEECSKKNDPLFINQQIEIEISKDKDIKSRLQNTVRKIMGFHPQFILDMADECFPEANALIKHLPIVNFPMRTKAYSSEADLYMVGDVEAVIADNKTYNAMLYQKLRKVTLANLVISKNSMKIYERVKLGWKKEDFLIVTVGSRLYLEIEEELLEQMYSLLQSEKNFKWLLVGDMTSIQSEKFKQYVELKKIVLWGYEEELEALYKVCDVYLNPKRQGGGVSIRLAMKQGIPIAMLDCASDVKARMKPEHLVHGGYEELMQYVKELYRNQELYEKVSKETKKVIDSLLEESDCEKVLHICKEAVDKRKKEGEMFEYNSY